MGRYRQGNALITSTGPSALYEREKALGLRRENGARKLRSLNSRHMEMISMHIDGDSNATIAARFGCTQATVSRILQDPLAQDIIQQALEDSKIELKALGRKAVKTVRDGLNENQSMSNRLKAVDRYSKLRETMIEDDGEQTAEDVIARVLSQLNPSNVYLAKNMQINNEDGEDE